MIKKYMNINEEQNRAKLIKLRKQYTISSVSSFLSFMERTDRLGFKDMTIGNKRL